MSKQQYRTDPAGPVHYIDGKLIQPGEVVTLPSHVKPGQFMKPVSKGGTSSEPPGSTEPPPGGGLLA